MVGVRHNRKKSEFFPLSCSEKKIHFRVGNEVKTPILFISIMKLGIIMFSIVAEATVVVVVHNNALHIT